MAVVRRWLDSTPSAGEFASRCCLSKHWNIAFIPPFDAAGIVSCGGRPRNLNGSLTVKSKRIIQLDGIRAVAILAVCTYHAFSVKLLWMGVDIFFVLSGFLITGVLLDAKHHPLGEFFSHFYQKRSRRILVPYLIFLFLASFVWGTEWLHHWYLYIFLTNLLQPLSVPYPHAFNSLWSLAVEEQFYFLWPFAVYFLSVRSLKRLCIFLVILAPILRGSFHFSTQWPIYSLTPFRMDLLAAGGLLCLLYREDHESVKINGLWRGGPFLVLAGLVGMFALDKLKITTGRNTRLGNVLVYEFCLLIAVGLMLYALRDSGVGWLKSRPMTYIGQISYSMYLANLGFSDLAQARFARFPAALISFALTISYAAILWHLVESPLLGRKRTRPKGIQSPTHAEAIADNGRSIPAAELEPGPGGGLHYPELPAEDA